MQNTSGAASTHVPAHDDTIYHLDDYFVCGGVRHANLSDVPGWPQYTDEEREDAHACALANMDANGNVRVGGSRMELAETTHNAEGKVVRTFTKAEALLAKETVRAIGAAA